MGWIAVLGVALLLAGCVGWAGGPEAGQRSSISGWATVQIGGYEFPLAGARVVVGEPFSGTTTTLRDGSYSYHRLAPGSHKVTLRPLHGTYEQTVFIADGATRSILDWRVRPQGLDAELFFHLSGLKGLYVDDWGGFTSDYGTLVRWEKPTIKVYFDEIGAPPGLPQGTVAAYLAELRGWEGYLDYRLAFVRTTDPNSADIAVYWVPEGYLYDHAGIARHVSFYANGALKRVEIEIDVAYANFPGLWEHEFAHAMGADHVSDQSSVLHPYLLSGQRTTLSSRELAHIRLMYDIPSGQELRRDNPYGALVASDAGAGDMDSDAFGAGDGGDPGPGVGFGADRSAIEAVNAKSASGSREHILQIDESLLQEWLFSR